MELRSKLAVIAAALRRKRHRIWAVVGIVVVFLILAGFQIFRIYRENSQRFIPLKYSVRERDLGSTVAQAQAHLAQTVPLPQGYRMEWTGEYGAMVEAQKRLAFIVPLSLLLIMMLLYGLFNSIRDSLIALSGIPFAVSGGILGLYVAELNASVFGSSEDQLRTFDFLQARVAHARSTPV